MTFIAFLWLLLTGVFHLVIYLLEKPFYLEIYPIGILFLILVFAFVEFIVTPLERWWFK